MKIKHITLTSLALAVATLMTACNDDYHYVQKPTELVKPTTTTTPSNPSNPTPQPTWDNTISYGALKAGAEADTVAYVRSELGVTPTDMTYSLTIDGKPQTTDIDLSQYGKGYSAHQITETVTGTVGGERGSITRNSNAYIFQQDYSVVAGIHNVDMVGSNGVREEIDEVHFAIKGDPTKNLPTTGTFNYTGSAKVATSASSMSEGKFSYDVDFVEKTGSGSISGLSNYGNIELTKGNIQSMTYEGELDSITMQGVNAIAMSDKGMGGYTLGFFGPNAEEVVGKVEILENGREGAKGIFGGTKQTPTQP